MRLWLACVVVCGCGVDSDHGGWHDEPGAVVTATASPGIDPIAWTSNVSSAVAEWNAALQLADCPQAFAIGADGHDVHGYNDADWPHPGVAIGWTYPDGEERIEVIATIPDPAFRLHVIEHELGHAMGLNHTARFGIMHPPRITNPEEFAGYRIQPDDIADACAALAR